MGLAFIRVNGHPQPLTFLGKAGNRILDVDLPDTGGQSVLRVRETFNASDVATVLAAWASNAAGNSLNATVARASLGEIFFNNVAAGAVYTLTNGPLHLGTNNILAFTITTDQALEGPSIATPAAPAASSGRLYFDTNAGKIRLMARFPTGAAQAVATEP